LLTEPLQLLGELVESVICPFGVLSKQRDLVSDLVESPVDTVEPTFHEFGMPSEAPHALHGVGLTVGEIGHAPAQLGLTLRKVHLTVSQGSEQNFEFFINSHAHTAW
jgi:hypothetical protein